MAGFARPVTHRLGGYRTISVGRIWYRCLRQSRRVLTLVEAGMSAFVKLRLGLTARQALKKILPNFWPMAFGDHNCCYYSN